MKKTLLTLVALSMATALQAQLHTSRSATPVNAKLSAKKQAELQKGISVKEYHNRRYVSDQVNLNAPNNPSVSSAYETPINKAGNRVTIGKTTYDLQTNASVAERIINYGGGKVSATYIHGTGNWIDRGMGYNHTDNGTTWTTPIPVDINGINRIENIRTGFGGITRSQEGEMIVAHTGNDAANLNFSHNTAVGGATFSFNMPSAIDSVYWPRAVYSGVNNEYLQVIALTEPASTGGSAVFNGAKYRGINGCLVYFRSSDNGVTWQKNKVVLPGIDSTMYKFMSGDDYTIVANKEVVAIICRPNIVSHTFVMKSTDNGNTWTKKTFLDWKPTGSTTQYDPKPGILDVNGDGRADTAIVGTGSLAAAIDDGGKVHVVSGFFVYTDTFSRVDTLGRFNPVTDGIALGGDGIGLVYWNDVEQQERLIGGLIDENQDVNNRFQTADTVFTYVAGGLNAFPSVAIGPNGDMYVTYSAPTELVGDARQFAYNHIFGTFSKDAGANWSTPVNMFGGPDEYVEMAFPSLAKLVDNNLHIVYQEDDKTGSVVSVAGTTSNTVVNDIVYGTYPVASLSASIEEKQNNVQNVTLYPNPTSDRATVVIEGSAKANASINVMDIAGKLVKSSNVTIYPGTTKATIEVANLPAGLYFVTVQTEIGTKTVKMIIK